MPSRGSSGIAAYMAWNTSANDYQTGDSANHTIRYFKDGVETTPANSPSEVDSTNMPGAYAIAWTSAEGTCNILWIGGKSSTSNVYLIPITIGFGNLPVLPTTLLTTGSGVNVSQLNGFAIQANSGFAQANLVQWEGVAPSALVGGLVQATFSGTTPGVNVVQIAGTATVGQAGYVGIDWGQIANPTTRQGLTATTISGLINSPTVTLQGMTSTAQFGVNVVTWLGQTPATLTGAGQNLVQAQAIVSGIPAVNVTQIAGSASVGTAGYVGIDWGQIANPTTRQGLTATTTSGLINAPAVTIQGITSQAQFGVNVVTFAGNPVVIDNNGLPSVNVEDINQFPTVGSPGYVGIDWNAITNQGVVVKLTHTTISGLNNGVNVAQWEGVVPSPLINGLVQATFSTLSVNVATWLGATPNSLTGAGNVQADVEQWRATAPNTLQSGRVDATVGQVQANAIGTTGFVPGALTTTVFGAPFLTSASYDTTYSNGLADALGNRANAVETGITPYLAWRYTAAAEGGVTAGALTPTFTIQAINNSGTNRITASTDGSGNRLAVTLS